MIGFAARPPEGVKNPRPEGPSFGLSPEGIICYIVLAKSEIRISKFETIPWHMSKRPTVSLREMLSDRPVEASAPCRIDSGGTWDIKAMALPFQGIHPTTVNMALTLRTSVTLSPYDDRWVRVSSDGFPEGEACPENKLSFDSPFGLFFAAVSFFGFHGLHVHIRSQSPVKSALGGSSTALVALLKCLARVSQTLGGKALSNKDLLHLGYHLEDGVSGGNCGQQDQAAAVYGGVHQWVWHYEDRRAPVTKISLLDRRGQRALSKRILVAYSGKSHVSARTNRKWIGDFLSGKTRAGWIEANEVVHLLAQALKEQRWRAAATLLRDEMAIRKEITPEAWIPITEELMNQAEKAGCGARFAGAGAGGSIWALGEAEDIADLRKIWESSLRRTKGGGILNCEIDPVGVK
jgi:D-glycero-alpha-D-manno-heptose-7-phosphate kinase